MTVGDIGRSYLRYIGAGMMLSGGLIGAVRLVPTIVTSIRETFGAKAGASTEAGAQIGHIILLGGVLVSFVAGFVISGGNIVMAILVSVLSLVLAMLFVIVSAASPARSAPRVFPFRV